MAVFPQPATQSEQLGHFEHENVSRPAPRHFVPTLQYQLPRYACPNAGRRYNVVNSPEGRESTIPTPCHKCDQCLAYRKYQKFQKWDASRQAPTSTILVAIFASPDAAAKFAEKKGILSRSDKIRSFTILRQVGKTGLTEPCWVRIIWDANATDNQIRNARKRARNSGGRRLNTTKDQASEEQFLEWIPDVFTLPGEITSKRKTGEIKACRFSKNCAKPLKVPNDWRDGLSRNYWLPSSSTRRNEPQQSPRGQTIRNSWRRVYMENPESFEATRLLERARYINAMDWLQRWMETYEENSNLDASQAFINAYLQGRKPRVKEWQQETRGPWRLVVETAHWLNGERDPEPATMLVAEVLGFRTRSGGPHIDGDFLNDLMLNLPPFEMLRTSARRR